MLITSERPAATAPLLTTTVAREYVHRAALSEVFLTGWEKTGHDMFTVNALWPRSHSFYNSEHGMHDPLLLCETVRQAGLLLSHVGFHVPLGHPVGWGRIQYTLNPDALRIEGRPAELELQVTCSDIRYSRSLPSSMSMHIEVVRNGALLALVSLRFGCHTPAVYERLRGGRNDVDQLFHAAPLPPEPVSRSSVGRLRKQDIVLSPTEQRHRWRLRVDTSHPVLFDHALDHVPGMLLLEAVRQAAHATQPIGSATLPVAMDVSFNRYVEFDEPCWIEVEQTECTSSTQGPRQTVRVNALQNGVFAFNATTDLIDVSMI
jgi:hypothetical protein